MASTININYKVYRLTSNIDFFFLAFFAFFFALLLSSKSSSISSSSSSWKHIGGLGGINNIVRFAHENRNFYWQHTSSIEILKIWFVMLNYHITELTRAIMQFQSRDKKNHNQDSAQSYSKLAAKISCKANFAASGKNRKASLESVNAGFLT